VPREALEHLDEGSIDVAFLATPAEVSLDLAPRFLDLGAKVIDLSGAFRLPNADNYPLWYGFKHHRADLLEEAHRGVVEWAGEVDSTTRLIANPGCYPTASTLALKPFFAGGLTTDRAVIVEGKSGVTGAGRNAALRLSLGEAGESISAYGYPRHKHTPEMEQHLRQTEDESNCRIAFIPQLLPVRRGILVTAHVQIGPEAKTNPSVQEMLADPNGQLWRSYEQAPFVRVLSDRFPGLRDVVGSNLAAVRAMYDHRTDVLSVFCSIDNLLKGAAGQAVQYFNILTQRDPTEGLELLTRVQA
jgi:N-acetyl-gamma-glutamyl-phosphate reductase